MLTSFLAQFWGIVLIIISAGMFLRPENVLSMTKLSQNENILVFSGFIGVMMGVGHILLFNVWSNDWTVIITLIGWIILAKGCIRIFIPRQTQKIIAYVHGKKSRTNLALAIIFIIGMYLTLKGFAL